MAKTELEARFKRVVGAAGEALKPYGYRKSGSRFRLNHSGNVALIAFQRSATSDADTIRFTVNLGVVSGELLRRWDPERDIAKETVESAHLRERIGAFLANPADHWWTVTGGNDAANIEEELIALLVSGAVPFLAAHLDDADLLSLWRTGRAPGLTEAQRLRNITQLEAALEV